MVRLHDGSHHRFNNSIALITIIVIPVVKFVHNIFKDSIYSLIIFNKFLWLKSWPHLNKMAVSMFVRCRQALLQLEQQLFRIIGVNGSPGTISEVMIY